MNVTFDIREDELQIFLAEAEEHLQRLDEGLLRLEREGGDAGLLQEIFRAAHTLKGSAGMIGHQRMAELTHAMETVLDGVRKHTVAVSAPLVDACLDALDHLKLLRDEVATGVAAAANITPCVERLLALSAAAQSGNGAGGSHAERAREAGARSGQKLALPDQKREAAQAGSRSSNGRNGNSMKSRRKAVKSKGELEVSSRRRAREASPAASRSRVRRAAQPGEAILIRADIAADSIASAARAFQVLLALQSFGEVRDLQPPQSAIESAAPVQQVTARLITDTPKEEIGRALFNISEIGRITIDGNEFLAAPADSTAGPAVESSEAPKLGEFLVRQGYVSQSQLEAAIRRQATEPPPFKLLGQMLIAMGALTPEALDQALARHIQELQSALHVVQSPPERLKSRPADKTIRTSIERLDNLMNLVGELITDRNRLYQIRGHFESRFRGDEYSDNFAQTVAHVGRITDQLQEEVMRIRMLPIANVFHKFPRLVRDLAHKAGKQVELTVRGEETELDRSVIEEIGDPLIHLLRNAVDHGIEVPADRAAAGKPAHSTLLLTARHEESNIIVTVEDDGRGIDVERVKASAVQKGLLTEAEAAALSYEGALDLIFRSGLSTAKVVTDVSGRGVGMDIVRANIERLNGSVLVETWPGRGTRFQISLPLTLAIIPCLMVEAGAGTFAIPLVAVTEAMRVDTGDVRTIGGRPAIQLRGRILPLVRLQTVLGFNVEKHARKREHVVAVHWGKLDMGLIVDSLLGKQEMVIKSLGALVGATPGVSGAAILGDGRVALIVDVPGLFKLAGA
jgi:two-component system chemotaxis sensor kinase CheA